jgi:hypothetical protein
MYCMASKQPTSICAFFKIRCFAKQNKAKLDKCYGGIAPSNTIFHIIKDWAKYFRQGRGRVSIEDGACGGSQ